MADLIATGTSDYITGGIDSATVLVNNISPVSAKHPNGLASAIVQVETILGSGTSLKGTKADLVSRLAVALAPSGLLALSSGTVYTIDYGFIASSSSAIALANHTPVGAIIGWGDTAAPPQWVLLDGTLLSRFTYAKLFARWGTRYGAGDGSTTFGIPDCRGRTIIMVDGSANRITSASTNGANADTLGGVGGAETHTLTAAQTPVLSVLIGNGVAGGTAAVTPNVNSAAGSINVVNTSGGAAHSNTQPWIALNYIVFTGV